MSVSGAFNFHQKYASVLLTINSFLWKHVEKPKCWLCRLQGPEGLIFSPVLSKCPKERNLNSSLNVKLESEINRVPSAIVVVVVQVFVWPQTLNLRQSLGQSWWSFEGPSHARSTGRLLRAPGSVMEGQFLTAEAPVSQKHHITNITFYQDDLLHRAEPRVWASSQESERTSARVMWFCCLLVSFFGTQKSSAVSGFGVAALKRRKKKRQEDISTIWKSKANVLGVFGGEVTGT